MSGYNLEIITARYDLGPPPKTFTTMEDLMAAHRNEETCFLQGHAHLYINGEKVTRIYGRQLHLPAELFTDGMNQMNITLNNHAHMYWTKDNKEIIASAFVNTSLEDDFLLHRFDSFPATR